MNKTDDELKEIALGIHRGQIFTDRHVRNASDLGLVFLPLSLMTEEQSKDFLNQDLGMMYEEISKAAPRSVNGMPCFFSMSIITMAEAEKVIAYVTKYREAEATVV